MSNKITIDLKFPLTEARLYNNENSFDNILIKAFEAKGVKITKTRYTYVEGEYTLGRNVGMAKMPHSLMCVMFIIDHFTGFDWKLPEFSGKYTLGYSN